MHYQKIYDSIAKYGFSKADMKIIKNEEKWVVMEKIHGANFSVRYDKLTDEVSFYKRNGKLNNDEWFYNYQIIKEQLAKCMFKLNDFLQKSYDYKTIIVFGELFGGMYPGTKSNTRAVQEGVFYSNKLHFFAYDIYIDNIYLSYDVFIKVIKESNFEYVVPLLICDSYEEATYYDIKIDSKIPEQLKMPKLLQGSNIMEGVIIKPFSNIVLSNGNRCLIKRKNYDFLEYSLELNDKITNDYTSIFPMLLNKNRLQSAESKIGALSNTTFDDILEEMLNDMFIDAYILKPCIIINNQDEAREYVRLLLYEYLKQKLV